MWRRRRWSMTPESRPLRIPLNIRYDTWARNPSSSVPLFRFFFVFSSRTLSVLLRALLSRSSFTRPGIIHNNIVYFIYFFLPSARRSYTKDERAYTTNAPRPAGPPRPNDGPGRRIACATDRSFYFLSRFFFFSPFTRTGRTII